MIRLRRPLLRPGWHSPDPLAESTASESPYNYVSNNPINYIDPFGLDKREVYAYRSDAGDKGHMPESIPLPENPLHDAISEFGRYYYGNFPDPGPSFEEYILNQYMEAFGSTDAIINTLYGIADVTGFASFNLETRKLSWGLEGFQQVHPILYRLAYDELSYAESMRSGINYLASNDPNQKETNNNTWRLYDLEQNHIETLLGGVGTFGIVGIAAGSELPAISFGAYVAANIMSTAITLDAIWDYQEIKSPQKGDKVRLGLHLINYGTGVFYMNWTLPAVIVGGIDLYGGFDNFYKSFNR